MSLNNDADRPKSPISEDEAYRCQHMRCRTVVITAAMEVPVSHSDEDSMWKVSSTSAHH